jgi:centromere protein I
VLIKNLYALGSISSGVITRIVGSLGATKGKPSVATQTLLLRWLILVYDYLEDPSHLSKLYAVLFNCLDMISLRRPLCHLLSLITRRKHVKPFRIQALMELIRNVGDDEKELTSFLRIFKNYYPDIIITNIPGSRRISLFKHPDPEWTNRLKQLQDMNRMKSVVPEASTFQVVRRSGVKRSKIESVIPDVQTSRVQLNHISLEEVRGVDDFIEKLEKIELPDQIISTLGDPLARKYLLLVELETVRVRLEDWLHGFLNDEFEHAQHGEESEPLGHMLSVAVQYVRHTKVTRFLYLVPNILLMRNSNYLP